MTSQSQRPPWSVVGAEWGVCIDIGDKKTKGQWKEVGE